jgi:hypothetical protein
MKNNKIKTKFAVPLLIATLLTGVGLVGIAGVASAQSITTTTPSTTTQGLTSAKKHSGTKGQGVMGTVASVSGTTITVTGKNGTTYTVDASSAKFLKSVSGAKPTVATISNIAVGDTVRVNGTVSGTSVVAKSVMDGAFTARVHTSSPKKTTTTQ